MLQDTFIVRKRDLAAKPHLCSTMRDHCLLWRIPITMNHPNTRVLMAYILKYKKRYWHLDSHHHHRIFKFYWSNISEGSNFTICAFTLEDKYLCRISTIHSVYLCFISEQNDLVRNQSVNILLILLNATARVWNIFTVK